MLGYLYQFCMILQSSFLFHPLHRNKFWTLLLELGVVPHSVLIAIFFSNGNPGSAYQFGFGFSLMFLITQMHGFEINVWQKCGFIVLYVGALLAAYLGTGRPLANVREAMQFGLNFSFAPVAWCLWCLGEMFVLPCKNSLAKYPKAHGVFWFFMWLAQMILFVVLGPTE